MKLIMENFKRFLKEAEEKEYQIYCDMDGVLVDFVAGVSDKIANDIEDESLPSNKPTGGITKLGRLRRALEQQGKEAISDSDFGIEKTTDPVRKALRNYMYSSVSDDRKFWATLPWFPGGKEVWAMIKDHNPFILTSPMKGEGSKDGKRDWIDRNLSPAPRQVYMSHKKFDWADPKHVLIDDFMKNIGPWRSAGGIGLHHVDVSKTLKELPKYLGGIGVRIDEGEVIQGPWEQREEEYDYLEHILTPEFVQVYYDNGAGHKGLAFALRIIIHSNDQMIAWESKEEIVRRLGMNPWDRY